MSFSVERAVAGLTLRQILARRRALGLLALGLLPVLPAMMSRAADAAAIQKALVGIQMNLVVPVLLPLAALVVATSVFGGEIEDGTILYLLAKPVARWRLVLVRVLVAAAVTMLMVAPGALATGLVLAGGVDVGRAATAFPIAVCFGSLVYCALFVALSLSTRRALVVGLVYVVLWEGVISASAAGTRFLSVRHFILAVADRLSTIHPGYFNGLISPTAALVMGSVITVGATVFAVRRLERFEVGEAA